MYDYPVYGSVTGKVITVGECTADEIEATKEDWQVPLVEIDFINQDDGFPY